MSIECTCGAWEKIEEAICAIRDAAIGRGLFWSWCEDVLAIHDPFGGIHEVERASELSILGVKSSCELPGAIIELADKLDPPKPKEREWRVGDVVRVLEDDIWGITSGTVALIKDTPRDLRTPNITLSEGNVNTSIPQFRFGLILSMGKLENLTIEAEQAAE